MITNENTDYLNSFFHYLLLGVLLFSAGAFIVIFVINWEDWFFGLRVEGLPAGILLFVKFLISALLVSILVRFPERISLVAGTTLVFFGFLLTDSLVTIHQNSGNMTYLNIVPVVFTLIPAMVLIGRGLMNRTRLPNSENRDPIISSPTRDLHERYKTGNRLMLVSAGIVIVILTGPAIFSLVFFHTNSDFSPADLPGKTLVSKVNAKGITEWQTPVRGFSNFPLSATHTSEGDTIIGGMFSTSGSQDPSLRILKLNTSGTVLWDVKRGVFSYPETNLGALHSVLSSAGEYTVIMADGFVIRLDSSGNEVWYHKYPDAFVQASVSLPDGGYLLTGQLHEGDSSSLQRRIARGWILRAGPEGNILWERKDSGFTNCRNALLVSNEEVVVSCFVSGQDPGNTGNLIIAMDLQGNDRWKQTIIEKDEGIIATLQALRNGTLEVNLRGEGERRYLFDQQGNILNKTHLPDRPGSFSHDVLPDFTYHTESLPGNLTRIHLENQNGSNSSFIINTTVDHDVFSGVYSINPVADGGYLVASSLAG